VRSFDNFHSAIKARFAEYQIDVTYLDHAGTTLYAKSLVNHFSRDMIANLYGNPHSASPSSDLSTQRVEEVRTRILRFFRADPECFDIVFVANASAAIKLVVEAFREIESPGFWYGYHRDAHTSLVGIRQLASSSTCFESDGEVEAWLKDCGNGEPLEASSVGLFAYPAQSNMNGHRTPLRWAGDVRRRSGQKIYTLLDAAAYVTTAQLDLSDETQAPDFTALSLYKIFGFPDMGALIVRKAAGNVLRRRRYFGGGTVDMVTVMKNPWHARKGQTLHDALEDGTLPFHQIVALGYAIDVHADTFGSMANVSEHTCALSAYTYSRLQALRHSNGRQVCVIYKDEASRYGDSRTQGPTIAFNIKNAQSGWIGKSHVERLAIVRGIHLRTGGVCNAGGIATFCNLAHWELRRNFSEGMRCGDDLDIIGGKPTGIVRVSFGAMSNQRDADTLLRFVDDLFVEKQIVAMPNQGFAAAQCRVESLTIFPVVGCGGCDVPPNVSWAVGKRGLAWDREWCVVREGSDIPLDSVRHPRLMLIKPELDIEHGSLRLTGPGLASKPTSLEISLWDSPAEQNPFDLEHIPADSYQSEAIRAFFTKFLGFPSTLARFRDSRRVAKDRRFSIAAVPSLEGRSISVSLPSPESCANLTIPYAPRWTFERYIQINQHIFEKVVRHVEEPSSDLWRLTYLHDVRDKSAAAQNPCIKVGDEVRSYAVLSGRDASTNCVSSSPIDVDPYICVVWHCQKIFKSEPDLEDHLDSHKSRLGRRSRFTNALGRGLG
jgi:molybdenum cofactor sulfurtransferase